MVVAQCLARRWADESEDDEDEWTSEAMQELKEKLYPEIESLKDVETFLETLDAASVGNSWEDEDASSKDVNQVEEARNLLTKVESITRTTLPIHIRARKAAARALLTG